MNGFSSCTFLYEWLSLFFEYGFSSYTFLFEWLSVFFCIWMYVMHISVRMTSIFFWIWIYVMHIYVRMTSILFWVFCHVHLCTNDYLFPISFQCVSVKQEYVCNVLQRVNCMVQWRIINDVINYIYFDHECNTLQRVNRNAVTNY